MQIRPAQASDGPAILEIILPVIREAATYTLDPNMPAAEALALLDARARARVSSDAVQLRRQHERACCTTVAVTGL
jgi:hypothetical protein